MAQAKLRSPAATSSAWRLSFSLRARLRRLDDGKIGRNVVEHGDQLAELARLSFDLDIAGLDGVGECRLPDQDRIKGRAGQDEASIRFGREPAGQVRESRVLRSPRLTR
jgi:hypothetical protein